MQLERLAEAEPLTIALERNGRALNRPWMLAVGARCRAMLLAAEGDLDAAYAKAQDAMAAHEHLPMPFERDPVAEILGAEGGARGLFLELIFRRPGGSQ